MSKKRKRISRRRLAGQRVLAHVPTYNLETGEHKPVTAGRRFIAENGITPPALLKVRRNEHTTDHFFWGEKGLFSAVRRRKPLPLPFPALHCRPHR